MRSAVNSKPATQPGMQGRASFKDRAPPTRSARSLWGSPPLSNLLAPNWDVLGRPGPHNATEKKVFLEIFCGKAHLSWSVAQHGVPLLTPLDLAAWPPLVPSTDALDVTIEPVINEWIDSGRVGWLHFGTECRTLEGYIIASEISKL